MIAAAVLLAIYSVPVRGFRSEVNGLHAEAERFSDSVSTSDVILEAEAEDWVECAARLFAGTPKNLRSDAGWTDHIDTSKLSDADVASLRKETGPLPSGGIRMCKPGFAIGYDTALRNPAWAAFRLRPSEQREVDNARRSFILDPALSKADIEQTPSSEYTNTNFDKGHLAPSLAMSFQRKTLQEKDRSPWSSSYFISNVAPQFGDMNRNSWQVMEDALQEYAANETRGENDDVFVLTGVAYWNHEAPRRWTGDLGECWTECPPCGEACNCVECPADDYINIPSFFWQVACDPKEGSSFVIIAENDPESNEVGEDAGWPASVFTDYTPHDVEELFGVDLQLPSECHIDNPEHGLPLSWRGDRLPPPGMPSTDPDEESTGKFTMKLIGLGGNRVILEETVWLRFELPFGPAGDFHDTLLLTPPLDPKMKKKKEAQWKVDCESIFAHHLPAVEHCEVGADIRLEFGKPIKGGTFVFAMKVTAPVLPPPATSSWSASLVGGDDVEPVLESAGFELVRSLGHDWEEKFNSINKDNWHNNGWRGGRRNNGRRNNNKNGRNNNRRNNNKNNRNGRRNNNRRNNGRNNNNKRWKNNRANRGGQWWRM